MAQGLPATSQGNLDRGRFDRKAIDGLSDRLASVAELSANAARSKRPPRPGRAPAIDILRALGHVSLADATHAKHKLARIVQMLVGLRRR